MRKWKILAGLLAIFISGVVIGSVCTGFYVRHLIRERVNSLVSGDRDVAVQLVMERLTRSLGLSAEQKAEIEPIVREAAGRIRSIRARLRPQFMEVFSQASRDIKKHLDEKQKRKIDSLLKRIRKGLSASN